MSTAEKPTPQAASETPRESQVPAQAPAGEAERLAPTEVAQAVPVVSISELDAKRVEDLRDAAQEANEASERLEQAAKELPGTAATLLNGIAWAAGALLTMWGLVALASWWARNEGEPRERLPRGTEDAETGPMPTTPTTPAPVSAQ